MSTPSSISALPVLPPPPYADPLLIPGAAFSRFTAAFVRDIGMLNNSCCDSFVSVAVVAVSTVRVLAVTSTVSDKADTCISSFKSMVLPIPRSTAGSPLI